MEDDDFGPDYTGDDAPETLISISQSIELQKRVHLGKFASMDDAISRRRKESKLVKVGKDCFSVEVWERLEKSIAQADRGELIPGEEVMAKFADWLRRIEARASEDT